MLFTAAPKTQPLLEEESVCILYTLVHLQSQQPLHDLQLYSLSFKGKGFFCLAERKAVREEWMEAEILRGYVQLVQLTALLQTLKKPPYYIFMHLGIFDIFGQICFMTMQTM